MNFRSSARAIDRPSDVLPTPERTHDSTAIGPFHRLLQGLDGEELDDARL